MTASPLFTEFVDEAPAPAPRPSGTAPSTAPFTAPADSPEPAGPANRPTRDEHWLRDPFSSDSGTAC